MSRATDTGRILFKLEGVRKIRASKQEHIPGYILEIPKLEIQAGDTVAITGQSGSGKSTALDILGMALLPDAVENFLLDLGEQKIDVAACWTLKQQDRLAALRLQYVGYVLQTGGLLPFLTVRQNMELSAALKKSADREEYVLELARELGISRLLDVKPGQLSIGERQRVAIGRALAHRPQVILADEPTAALDPLHADKVLDLFLGAVNNLGVTLILVTHARNIVKNRRLKELNICIQQNEDGLARAVLES